MSEYSKSCPFCGWDGDVLPYRPDYTNHYEVCCGRCSATSSRAVNEKHAVELWNTRPTEEALRARVADLEAEQDPGEAVKAIDRAIMRLTGHGENNTSYLQFPRRLIRQQQNRIDALEDALEFYADEKMWISLDNGNQKTIKWTNSFGGNSSINGVAYIWRGHVGEKHPNGIAKQALKKEE